MCSEKDLHIMSSKESGQLFPIIIQVPCEKWVDYFESEKEKI